MTSETSSTETPNTATTNVFRTAQTPEAAPPLPETKPNEPSTTHQKADSVYVGYEFDNGVPYVASHYGIDNIYNQEPDVYHEEVSYIDRYIKELISRGELDNSLNAVSLKLGQLEKLAGVEKTDRTAMKLIQLAEYCKFMNNVGKAKRNMNKYGSSR